MTEDGNEIFDLDDDARDEVRKLIRGRGVRVAVQAAIDVAADPKAPAPARATCSGLLLKAAGLLDAKAQDDEDAKQPHEMNRAELDRAVANARAKAEALERKAPHPLSRAMKRGAGGIFD